MKAIGRNPTAAFKIGAESAPNAIVSLGSSVIGSAIGGVVGGLSGGGQGAAVGVAAGPAGSAAGLGAGAIIGSALGTIFGPSVANAVLETPNKLMENLREATGGKSDQMDENQIVQVLTEKPEIITKGLTEGATRGAAIGLVEGLFARGSLRLLDAPKRAQRAAVSEWAAAKNLPTGPALAVELASNPQLQREATEVAAKAIQGFTKAGNAARFLGAGAINLAGEAAGEVAGMASVGEPMSPTPVVEELLGSVSTSF